MTRLVNALNAVELPMLISARRQLTTTVKAIDPRGSEVRGSTYEFRLAGNLGIQLASYVIGPTFASQADPGRPFSRAKAHVIRDAVVRKPVAAKITAATIKDAWSVWVSANSLSAGRDVHCIDRLGLAGTHHHRAARCGIGGLSKNLNKGKSGWCTKRILKVPQAEEDSDQHA